MKKKFFLVIVLIILIGFLIFYFVFNKKDNKEIMYVSENVFPSTQVKFMEEKMLDVLNDLSLKSFNSEKYDGCSGSVINKNDVYEVSAKCSKKENNSYTIKNFINKNSKIEEFVAFKETTGGYFYSGYSNTLESSIVGFLNLDGSIKWEREYSIPNKEFRIYDFTSVDDGYIFASQNINSKELWSVMLLKVDVNGNLVKTLSLQSSAYMPYLESNNLDKVAINGLLKIVYVDKDLNEQKIIDDVEVIDIDIVQDDIYYLDSDNNVNLYKDGKSSLLFKADEDANTLEVVNNKFFLLGDNVTTYDKDYKKIKTFDYSNLSVKKGDTNYILSTDRFLDNIYINYYSNGYLVVDKFDQNLELVNRNVLKAQNIDFGNTIINMKIFMGEEIANLNYSDKYKAIVKTTYEF